jgi:hypothetical protein
MFVLLWTTGKDLFPTMGGIFTELDGAKEVANALCFELQAPAPKKWGELASYGGNQYSAESQNETGYKVYFQIHVNEPDSRLKWLENHPMRVGWKD